MNHVMLDIETLDTAPTAVVLSIGAVLFDPHTGETGLTFYANLAHTLDAQQRLGRTISGSTIAWWMGQSEEARAVFTPKIPNEQPLPRILERLEPMLSSRQVWGNGSDFDNVIMGSLYRSIEHPVPWRYSDNRCFRTLRALAKDRGFASEIDLPREGIHHNALDDALHQVKVLTRIYECLNLR